MDDFMAYELRISLLYAKLLGIRSRNAIKLL
jgi:hypothetical protein